MKRIDWSQAPEGFDKAYTTGPKWDGASSHKGEVRFARINASGYPQTSSGFCLEIGVSSWVFVEDRPATTQWSGEGLPPVGVVCEVKCTRRGAEREWFAAEINYVSDYTVVMDDRQAGEFVAHPATLQFRQIRTAEQIAAEEREAAIGEMINECKKRACSGDFELTSESVAKMMMRFFGTLHDAGYRKPNA